MSTLDDSSPINSLVKEGDVVTITMGKAQYKMIRQSNSGRALVTWRLYQSEIIKNGVTYHRMWVDSDAEGAIKEVGAVDFIGGFHGDETYTNATFLIDGKQLDLTSNHIMSFKSLDIFVESKLYHCDTVVEAFDRVKHLRFEDTTYTVTNK